MEKGYKRKGQRARIGEFKSIVGFKDDGRGQEPKNLGSSLS